ncbi:MAG: exodeoxyribonuclease I, partial [Gammaproteobacteria bacterium]
LLAHLPAIRNKLRDVYAGAPPQPDGDPDGMLYSGGFFSDRDKRLMNVIRATPPEHLGTRDWGFEDPRLPEMLFRYRARNWPETLNEEEFARWEKGRLRRLREPGPAGRLDAATFRAELARAREESASDGPAQRVLDRLEAWGLELLGGDLQGNEITP